MAATSGIDTHARTFDLNIERILEHWTSAHAVRELIANALDEALLSGTRTPEISKDAAGHWHIRDFGRGLRYESLTQNENNEKLSHPDGVIGKFGIGLKDALATLDRQGVTAILTSRSCRITTRLAHKHGFEDIATLHAVIERSPDPAMVGTDVTLLHLSDTDMRTAMGFFLAYAGVRVLDSTQFGQVLQPPEDAARIYVNGLEVAREENFLFSYNITSPTALLRKALNRERSAVGRTAYAERVRTILKAADAPTVTKALADDLLALETGAAHDEIQWADIRLRATYILNARDRVIFVTANELNQQRNLVDQAQRDGYQTVVVPDNTRDKLVGAQDIAGNEVRELGTYAREWSESFTFEWITPAELSPQERDVWERTDDILALVGGRCGAVREIRISQNIRPDAYGFQAAGLWSPDQGHIVIRRDQLQSLSAYAGTLLHEATHAATGHSDVSRDFEISLTHYLGRVAAEALTAGHRPLHMSAPEATSTRTASASPPVAPSVTASSPADRLSTGPESGIASAWTRLSFRRGR